ncbi:ImuA family protein [Nitratireductor soli]|uniref:ImuA family protein n=1 Tax=Nitratireductor soli TaxID=1670619 RepID=UPI00065DFF2B|nr:inducible mutagenesis protein A [Nitratireductor soli]
MSHAFDIEILRRRIAAQERLTPIKRPAVALGPAALDAALPEHGLATGALHELVPATHGDFAAGIGFGFCLLARIARSRPGQILWAAPAHLGFREGGLYPLGLAALGFDPDRLIQIAARKSIDILWALEEGLAHAPLAAVVGVLPENAHDYDFSASRRLAMRAARQGVTAFIFRGRENPGMSTAAETRWSVASLPSLPAPVPAMGARPGLGFGLGAPRWQVKLTKCKKGTPGGWLSNQPDGWDVEWDHETLSFRLPAPLADRAPAWAHGADNRPDDRPGTSWAEAS